MSRRHVESAQASLPIVGHVRNLSDCETDFGGGEFRSMSFVFIIFLPVRQFSVSPLLDRSLAAAALQDGGSA